MTYDSSISTDVSLSKVLDCFIIEDEDPNVIIMFLKQHDDNFKDILKYSLYCNKLFQLDFFLICNTESQNYIIQKLKDIPIYNAALFGWQILKSNSFKVQCVKHEFKKEFNWILKYGPKHPYGFRHEQYIAPLDNACFKLAEINRIGDIAEIVQYEKLCSYFKYMNYSLFQNRLMQYDVFSRMNDITKFIFFRDLFSNMSFSLVKKFVLQIFDSDENCDVKKLCFDKINERTTLDTLDNVILPIKYSDLVKECKSFSELMLKMSIFNADISQSLVLYLMLYKPKWILDWIDYDEKELNSILNISEFAKSGRFIRKKLI